jgi:hypothetical protein
VFDPIRFGSDAITQATARATKPDRFDEVSGARPKTARDESELLLRLLRLLGLLRFLRHAALLAMSGGVFRSSARVVRALHSMYTKRDQKTSLSLMKRQRARQTRATTRAKLQQCLSSGAIY